jgi:hypothetical protein
MAFQEPKKVLVCLWHGRHASDGSEKERDETCAKRRMNGGAIIDYEAARERRFVAVQK